MSKCELQGNVNYRRRARRQDERIKSRGAEEEDSGQLCGAGDNGSRMSQRMLRASNKQLKRPKLEYLANACACRDLSSDCNFQVSFLCDKAAVMYDDIDRMQLELTDLDFAIRTSIDDYAEQEQKLAYEHSNLSSLKIRSNIELVGGGRKKKKCAVPPNQTTINGFFTVAGLNSVDNAGHLSLKHLVVHSNILRISCFPVCCS